MELYIGVFGGHQKSTAVAIRDSAICCCVTGKGLNLHSIQHLKVTNRLGVLLTSLAEKLGLSHTALREQTTRLVLALPGAATKFEKEIAETCLLLNGWNNRSQYSIADDTWAGLIAGSLDRRGICVFAGTGAAVFVGLGDFPEDNTRKIDGWGHILGDFGSGFQLALEMFRLIGRLLDKGQSSPLFDDLLRAERSICGVEDLQRWFDQLYVVHRDDWRIRFAELAAVVTAAADRQEDADSDAVRLVNKAAEGIAESIGIAIERFAPVSLELPIVLQGGMFEYSCLYRHRVAEILRRKYPNEIVMASFRPVVGAGLMACAEDFILPPSELRQRVTESIGALSAGEQETLLYPSSSKSLTIGAHDPHV